jgi:predicted SprT family Zn-dependent metalloprotease
MTTNEVIYLARTLMDEHGLKLWGFAFSRSRKKLGTCYYSRKLICLSLFHATHDREELVRETILHEIAHAIAGHDAGHGSRWVLTAARIGCKEIGRCGKPEKGRGYVQAKGTYYAICPGCLHKHQWYKRPNMRGKYYCRSCGKDRGQLIPVKRTVEQPDNNQNVLSPRNNMFEGMFE